MTARPTYDELLARVAQLERQPEQQGGTASPADGEFLRADEALIEARATLSAIIDSTADLIWAVDPAHFGLMTFNHGFRAYFLRDRAMAIELGQRPEDLFPTEEFVRIWREYYGRALRDGPYSTEYAVYAGTRTLELSFNLMLRDGRAFGISVFGRDVTQRRAAEEALRKSEQKFRQITEESPVAIYIIQGGKLVYVNPSLAKQAGYSRDEIVGKLAPQDLIHRNDVARLMTTLGERAAGRIQGEGVEYRGIRKDGSLVHIEAYGMLMEYQGKPAVMGTLIDISARKRAEEKLREGEAFLSFVLATARTGTWDLDMVDHSAHRSLQHDQIFGYQEMLPAWTYEMFLEHVVAEDRDAVDQKFRHAVATQSDWSFECRILRRDGETRWIRAAGRHRMDDHGQPRWMAGIVQDITERRRLVDALSSSESRLHRALAAANAGTRE
jgi:PAS domain S-box-containing protein